MTSDRKLKASREGSKGRNCVERCVVDLVGGVRVEVHNLLARPPQPPPLLVHPPPAHQVVSFVAMEALSLCLALISRVEANCKFKDGVCRTNSSASWRRRAQSRQKQTETGLVFRHLGATSHLVPRVMLATSVSATSSTASASPPCTPRV